jgi:hypothetical protein
MQLERTPVAKAAGSVGLLEGAASSQSDDQFGQTLTICE